MIKGVICAMITPMCNQEINYEATTLLVEKLIDNGIQGLFILGTNGESHVLDFEEKVEFARHVIQVVNKRVPVICGVGENSTRASIALAKEMEKLQADAISVITPYFIPPSQEELYQHFYDIATSMSLPTLFYNMPARTGINIEYETLKRLSILENVVGIKDSSSNLDNMLSYLEIKKIKPEFSVLSGSDSLILSLLEKGGDGGVTSISNLMTKQLVGIYNHFIKNELEEARKCQESIEEFRKIQRLATIPSVLKCAITCDGIDVGEARKPVQPLNEETVKVVQKFVGRLGEF